jgi:hypothetical protein
MLAAACMAVDSRAPRPSIILPPKSNAVLLTLGSCTLPVSLRCPQFIFGGMAAVGGNPPLAVTEDIPTGRLVKLSFPPVILPDSSQLEVQMLVQWSPSESLLRKWARFRLTNAKSPKILNEIVLDDLDAHRGAVRLHPGSVQSYPAFLEGFFLGIEFPVASTRLEDGRLLLAHRPGLKMRPGVWYESRKAVYGLAPKGSEERAFRQYIFSHRPLPRGVHFNYNSWWTSPVPYAESDILRLMQAFEQRLYRRHGACFDTFCIDMGWSNPRTIWEIDTARFPHGFTRIQDAARRMKCHLGLWISPSSCYRDALDNEWAREQGYETFTIPGAGDQSMRFACLGGRRYREHFQSRLVDMVTRYGIRHIKFDGYLFECPESSHGHAPGPLSSEAIADGVISVFRAVRKAAPGIWLEPTCFGWDPSPWWLFYVNSVIGAYGDDAPYGRVPAPVYRDSYTTARDYFNLQGAHLIAAPIAAQEILGIVHQTAEPFLNDAVMTVMRGHMFLPIYLNPAFMNNSRWKDLSDLLTWARANGPLLEDTQPLLPDSWRNDNCPRFTNEATMPREPYGYAHWKGDRGLVAIRNPWILPRTFSLPLRAGSGLSAGARGLDAISLYPETRLYGSSLRPGDILQVPLAPYETVVLSLAPNEHLSGIPRASEVLRPYVKAAVSKRELARVEFEGPKEAFGPDFTCLLGEEPSAVRLRLEASVAVSAPRAELLVLLEGKVPPAPPLCRIQSGGRALPLSLTGSDTGWAASGLPKPEHWLFVRAPLVSGHNEIALEVLSGIDSSRASVWVWATRTSKPGRIVAPSALPKPEVISLDAAALMEPSDTSAAQLPVERMARPIERINGIFLDAIEPASVTLGWGRLQKNKSVWDKPMTIAGKRYLRGLGTHAPSRIAFALGGNYTRFQSWVGADGATTPTITFSVWVDGQKRWESGLMTRADPARRVDIDVTAAKTLELVVGDGGNGIACDHADWADARLLH